MITAFVGLLPFVIILISMIVFGIIAGLLRIPTEIVTEILFAIGGIGLVIIGVLIFVTQYCMRITPIEMFIGDIRNIAAAAIAAKADSPAVTAAVTATEPRICELMKRAGDFIRSEVGPKGMDDPKLVTVAMRRKLAVAEPVTQCDTFVDYECVLKQKAPANNADRLARMERTLTLYIYPDIKAACDATHLLDGGSCAEWNYVINPADSMEKRLAAINAAIDGPITTYLATIDAKTKDLKAGKLSPAELDAARDLPPP